MKAKFLKLKNFRSYKDEIVINLGDLTVIIGKNDIGKSTILEALEIFFNEGKGVIKIDKDDLNKKALADGDTDIVLTVGFEDFPSSLILDTSNTTDLESEYLLSSSGILEIVKKFANGSSGVKTYINAYHPSSEPCKDLLSKKDTELRKLIETNKIECSDKKKKAVMRSAIWKHYDNTLELQETLIDISKGEANSIWEKLQKTLPLYSLFQSDRKNSDGDSEVQDPLKLAVREILTDSNIQASFEKIAREVEAKLKEVSQRTLEKLREMDRSIADTLHPVIPSSRQLKWTDVFKSVSIAGDNDIPINKRGSGVKRLILLNFFRAEVERRMSCESCSSVIFAIEEPETSQHTENQQLLIKAFIELSQAQNTQVILTTHSAQIVKQLSHEHIILICRNEENKQVFPVIKGELPYPSLNEVNYMAFNEISDEYHNELYGHLECIGELKNFINTQTTIPYIKELKNGKTSKEEKCRTEYIRHQIHHPENKSNQRFTREELSQSIMLMREFIRTLA